MMTPQQHAMRGYTITEFKTESGSLFGITWYDTGEHTAGYATAEAAEKEAERILLNTTLKRYDKRALLELRQMHEQDEDMQERICNPAL